MWTLDRRNTLVVCLTALLVGACLILLANAASKRADDVRIEKERTEQARIEGCRTLADDEVRALCILGSRKAAS